jgi:hypothetical protein
MSLEKNPTTGLVIELFGPTVEYLTSPEDEGNDFCVMKGTIPPGGSVPLHAHADTEDFLIISGSVEGLRHDAEGYKWITAKAAITSTCLPAHTTPGATSQVNLWSTSSSRPRSWDDSFRRWESR